MLQLEKMASRQITGANYVTAVNGMLHPDRIMEIHDFLYILDGTWEIFEEETAYQLHTDDLLILSAGRRHYGKEPCNPGNRHMYLHVLPTEKEKEQEKCENVFLCPTLLHCQKTPRIRQYFHEIISCCWSKSPERDNRLSLLFNLLVLELAELCARPCAAAGTDSMVEEIIHRIHITPQTFFLASELASEYYICERTLNNRFHAACGKSLHTCQMEIHLEMVRQFLLSQPSAKLREVALNFGFCDEFHLSRAFKKQFGLSPSQYKAAQRTGL